jgi:transketolase
VLNVHTLKPLDTATLLASAGATGLVVTVEEHWRAGGLGGAVAEALAEVLPVPVHRIGLPDAFVPVAGSQRFLLDHAGVTSTAIAVKVRATLGRTVPTPGGDRR